MDTIIETMYGVAVQRLRTKLRESEEMSETQLLVNNENLNSIIKNQQKVSERSREENNSPHLMIYF